MKKWVLLWLSIILSYPAFAQNSHQTPIDFLNADDPRTLAEYNRIRRENVEQKLNEKEHIGLEILLANPALTQPSSLFGHIFFRFLDKDNNSLNDLTVGFNFIPLTSGQMKVFNEWAMYPFAESLFENIHRYQKTESRKIHRWIIPSDSAKLGKIKELLLQINEVPSIIGDYHLFSNNCVTAILKILGSAGYPLPMWNDLVRVDLPSFMGSYLNSNFINPYPPHEDLDIKGASLIFEDLSREFQNNFLMRVITGESDGDFLNQEKVWQRIEELSNTEIEKLLLFWPTKLRKYESRIRQIYRSKNIDVSSLHQLVDVTDFPIELYQLCGETDRGCLDLKSQVTKEVWPHETLKEHGSYQFAFLRNERQRSKNLATDRVARALNNSIIHEAEELFRDWSY